MNRSGVMVLMLVASLAASSAEDDSAGASNAVAVLHAKVITPASDALFQAESALPSTAHEWEQVSVSAAELVKAAARLASREVARDQGQWLEFAQSLKAQAEQAVQAARNKDPEALVAANGEIVSVCEDCHATYRDGGRSMKQ